MMASWWNRIQRWLTIDEGPSDFSGPSVELAFQQDNEAKTLRGVKLAILYALVFNPIFLMLDLAHGATFAGARLLLELALSLVFVCTVQAWAKGRAVLLGLLTLYIAGIPMAWMAQRLDAYYAGISLVIVGSVLIPWSVFPAFLGGAGLCLIYVVTLWAGGKIGEPNLVNVLNNSFFMWGAALIATGVTWYAHNLRKEAFFSRFQQARAIREQHLINAQLSRQHIELQARTEQLAEANAKLAEKSVELGDANEKLADQYRLKSRFLDTMSHELRTPLTLIQTPVQMLLSGPLEAEQRAILTDVEYAAQQLHEEINEILDISKYENKAKVLHYEQVDPGTLVRHYLNSWGYKAREKGLSLEVEAPEGLPRIWLDRREFIKVLRNLVSNAVKYTPAQGRIRVGLSVVDQCLELFVSDTGSGVAQEELEHLFEPFYQADNKATHAQEGTGLGLALVRDIIELHGGGKPTIRSQVGKGTTVTVRLPLRKPDHVEELGQLEEGEVFPDMLPSLAPPGESEIPPEEGQTKSPLHISTFLPGFQKDRILVVEDNRHLSGLLARVLAPLYTVHCVQDGVEAKEQIALFQPDLVLSDINMPRMTGTQLLDWLRKSPEWARTPVILLTANASASDRVRGLKEGANDYITKPFHQPELLARINNLLRLRSFEKHLERHNEELFGHSKSLETELRRRFMNTVSVLVGAIDCKDAYTAGHSERVSYYARIIAEPFELPTEELETLELGALMHDVGKIGIPDAVLNKPGKLTEEEHRIIQLHPTYADQILRRAPELDLVRKVVVHHHERWDGKGYPYQLQGENIPFLSRIVSMADCWDAMVSDRIYRRGMDPLVALDRCKAIAGTQIEPRIVDALCAVWERLVPPAHLKPLKMLQSPMAQESLPGKPDEARASTCAWNDPAVGGA
jgi:response regulator RpfG family c-di-GMP phosphodiesterase/signal transduction histidine kinase